MRVVSGEELKQGFSRYDNSASITLDPASLLDARSGEHNVIDISCGSRSFLVSLAARAIEETRRTPQDCATRAMKTRQHLNG